MLTSDDTADTPSDQAISLVSLRVDTRFCSTQVVPALCPSILGGTAGSSQ
jgi:hypothetical protein